MTLEHSTYKKARTDSSFLDVLMIEEEGNATTTTAFNKRSSIKRTVGREERRIRKNQSTSDSDKGEIVFLTISV